MSVDWWWEGVAAWYNNDFIFAMEAWMEALPLIHSVSAKDLVSELQRREIESEISDFEAKQISEMAPLALFLAGCYMDAGKYAEARGLLLQAISKDSSKYLTQAIRECIANIDEDPSISATRSGQNRSHIARRLVEYAIRNGSSGWNDPLQRPGFIFPDINSKPVWEKENFPSWCQTLEQNWQLIRTELESSLQYQWPSVGSGSHRGGAGAHDGSVVSSGDWNEIVLFGSGADHSSHGNFALMCEATRHLLMQHVPDAVDLAQSGGGEIIFSKLSPRTRIDSHCGTTNVRLTAHLGLIIPSETEGKCEIRVGDQWLSWSEGEMIVFDDSYEHEVVNDTGSSRIVLLLRFWHPELPKSERQIALEQAFLTKTNDRLSRYNPPFPPHNVSLQQRIHARGMKQSYCPACGRTGFETIRLQKQHKKLFACTCGAEIK